MNIDNVLKLIEEEFAEPEGIPEFLLVKNRKPLTLEQEARLAAVRVSHPTVEDKWRERKRVYDAEGARRQAIKDELAEPAKQAFFAKKKAEAAEIKAVKDAAKKANGK